MKTTKAERDFLTRYRHAAVADWRRRVRVVQCPACGAKPGMPCTGKYGQPTVTHHVDRSTRARLAGMLG